MGIRPGGVHSKILNQRFNYIESGGFNPWLKAKEECDIAIIIFLEVCRSGNWQESRKHTIILTDVILKGLEVGPEFIDLILVKDVQVCYVSMCVKILTDARARLHAGDRCVVVRSFG